MYLARPTKGSLQGYVSIALSTTSCSLAALVSPPFIPHRPGAYIQTRLVKRAIRALESPEYAKAASKKGSKLPPVTNRAEAENVFRLLPMNLMALRVSKIEHADEEGHEGHSHGKKKRVKGQWDVKIEQHQEVRDELYYCWFWEGPQWKQTVMAVGVLAVLLAVVMFPLWPPIMRLGVWYLSMGMLGLVGLFIAMSIFRLILFIITMVVVPPGLWLYPNLFEDVGFFDS